MAGRLPRLPKDLSLVNKLGRVSVEFQRWWQKAMEGIENLLLDLQEAIDRITTNETDIAALEAVTFTADNGLTGGGSILSNPAFAVGAGTGIVVAADSVSVSATLAAYHGGDLPSAFTLGIVDSIDAAAWRAAIGASATTGTVTSVAASVPTGFAISGSPITTSGTLAITYAAGYQGYTTAEAAKVAGSALTKTDDTNVTLTLGGTPTTALLAAASLTLGWTGQLSIARGGTNASTAAGARSNLGFSEGNYTPTGSNTVNTTAWTFKPTYYKRDGDTVIVAGYVDVTCTAAGTSAFQMTLPVASNFSTNYQANGSGSLNVIADGNVSIFSDSTTDKAQCNFVVPGAGTYGVSFMFMYPVI